jgi:hypothetical protein
MKNKVRYFVIMLFLFMGIAQLKAQDDITLTITLDVAFDMNTEAVAPATEYDNVNAAIAAAFTALGGEETLETHGQYVKEVILTGSASYCYFDFRGIRTAFPNIEKIDMSGALLWDNGIQAPVRWNTSSNMYAGYDPGQSGGALCNLSKLKTVIFPETLTNIGNYAIRGCPQLTNVDLPAGLVSISREGFQGDTNLTIPNGLPKGMNGNLGASAFDGCSKLALTTLPANLGITGDATYIFRNCPFVTFSEINGKIAGNDTKRRYHTGVFQNSGVSIKEIPEGIYTIGQTAFYNCANIDTITFPETLGKSILGTNGITSSILSQAFVLPAGSNVQRIYIFKSENPPLGGTTENAFNKGTSIDPTAIVYVPNAAAVAAFKAATPYDQMTVSKIINTITIKPDANTVFTTDYLYKDKGIEDGAIDVKKGDAITFTITPQEGFVIAKVLKKIDDQIEELPYLNGHCTLQTAFIPEDEDCEISVKYKSVWTGGEGNVDDNWSSGNVPAEDDDIYIPAVEDNIPTVPGEASISVKTITFEQGAQVDLQGSLTATDAVNVEYTIEAGKWYSIGFPFDISEIRSEWFDENEWGALRPYKESLYEDTGDYGDYWIKEYDYTSPFKYHTVEGMEAGKGYIIQFPGWFNAEDGTNKIKFVSSGQTLSGSADIILDENEYQFVANPKLKTVQLQSEPEANTYYYAFNFGENRYDLLEGNATAALLPFEATIAIKVPPGTSQSMLARSISIDTGVTGIVIRPDVTNDPVVATHYYTLQGVEVKRPVESGVYIVKRIYASGEEKSEKIIHQQK